MEQILISGDLVECKICDNSFLRISSSHLKYKHDMIMKDYRLEYPSAAILSQKYLNDFFLSHLRNISKKGAEISNRDRKNKTNAEIFGKDKAADIYIRASEGCKKQWRENPIYSSVEYRDKLSQSTKGIPKTEDHKQKIRIATKRNFLDSMFCTRWGRSHAALPNKLELFLDGILQRNTLGWKYTGDFSFNIAGFNPDFVNENLRCCIEVFTGYWKIKHWKSISRYKRIRKYRYNRNYWSVVFFSDKEIARHNEDYVVNKIDRLIRRKQ